MEITKQYTLITGATGGLGVAFCHACARRGEHLLLTGRREEKLQDLRRLLTEKYPEIEIEIYAANLAEKQGRYALKSQIIKDGKTIFRLINVAGADIQKAFCKYDEEKINFQCQVNFQAAVELCHFALSQKGESLKIINISSVSGIYPMPYFAIYSATKSALVSFSMALREEVKGQGVNVTAVLPGAMPTREDVKEQIKGQGLWGKLAVKSPQEVAEKSLIASDKNQGKYIPGFFNNVMNIFTKLIPLPLKLKFIAKRWGKIEKDAF